MAETGPSSRQTLLGRVHLDLPLLLLLFALSGAGLVILYSAGSQDLSLVSRQAVRMGVAFAVMVVVAQIPPWTLQRWAPWLFGIGLGLLAAVLLTGEVGKGAQRWLDFGVARFQPSELMKIAVPMAVAAYLADTPLPPSPRKLLVGLVLGAVPVVLVAKQPDLGTALLIGCSAVFVLFFAGVRWRWIAYAAISLVPAAWAVWEFAMHEYQRQRVLTFLNPEADPLGAGYHIIQSKIAVGSGGLYGKGWLNGTQAHLDFLPERSTDFIFAVFGEEFGLNGALVLLGLYLLVVFRCLYIATQAQDTFTRLLAGGLTLVFLVYVVVNIGMVTGLLPVVGLPLPLISYGGSAMVTVMAAFGILMSIHTHRLLLKD